METKDIEVLYEDNHLIVVKKPAGELVQGDITGDIALIDRVRFFIKNRDRKTGNVFLGLVHRLDKPVEGIVLFAKTSKGASRISEQFRTRKTKKTYRAVIEGVMDPSDGVLKTKLLKDENSRKASSSEEGKESVLEYRTIEKGKNNSLIEIDLGTGRFHQIRAQLSEAGHPIIGDWKYGSRISLPDKAIALAAVALDFKAATGEKDIRISIKDPIYWRNIL